MSRTIDVTNITLRKKIENFQDPYIKPILVGLSSNLKQNNVYDFSNQWRKNHF